MPRNRIIYQSQAVGITGDATNNTLVTLHGVQSVTYGIEVSREEVNQFGQLGAVDRIVLEAPTATQEVQFHYPNGLTAAQLTALVTGSLSTAVNGLLIALDSDEGQDYAESNNTTSTVYLKSGRLSSLSFEASVGAIPSVTLGFEGTALVYANAPATPVAAPTGSYNTNLVSFTGVNLTLANGSATHIDTHAQSATLSFDLGSEGLQRLGAGGLVYARVPTFPATATLEVEGLAIDRGMSLDLDNLSSKASDSANTDLGGRTNVSVSVGSVTFTLVNATLDSVSYNNAIGDNATCSATFGVSIGGVSSSSTLLIT